MGAEAHPVGVSAQAEEGGLRAELTEEGTLFLSVRGGAGLGWLRRPHSGTRLGGLSVVAASWRGLPARQSYTDVSGLDSGAVS